MKKDAYLDAVARKLELQKDNLQFGGMGEGAGMLRDEAGVMHTFSNVLKIADTLFDNNFHSDRTNACDPIADKITNFSGGAPGIADVAKVETIGAIDVTIYTLVSSLVPYLAIDRSMENPTDVIYYMNLVASQGAGDIATGDIVSNNFSPPNSDVNLGPAYATLPITGDGNAQSVDFADNLVPGNVVVTVVTPDGTVVGKDFDRDGNIFFPGGLNVTAVVDYNSGSVSVDALAADSTASVTVLRDVDAGDAGDNILKVKEDWVDTTLRTAPHQIILETNLHNRAYMGKIQNRASRAGGALDYTDVNFKKISDLYIEDINRMLIKTVVSLGDTVLTPTRLDLESYAADKFASTKNDLIDQFMIDMRTTFLQKTGFAPTVILAGSKGCAILESHPDKWLTAPGFYGVQNGLAGTYNGIPVYRHNVLDVINSGTPGIAKYYMAMKLPDNSAATLAFGEYLPLTDTGTVGNYNNPSQQANGFFSHIGHSVIHNTLVHRGELTLPSANPIASGE